MANQKSVLNNSKEFKHVFEEISFRNQTIHSIVQNFASIKRIEKRIDAKHILLGKESNCLLFFRFNQTHFAF
jgi:hypothetical protein